MQHIIKEYKDTPRRREHQIWSEINKLRDKVNQTDNKEQKRKYLKEINNLKKGIKNGK